MFPANIRAIGGRGVMGVVPRGIVQVIFLAAVLIAGYAPWVRERRLE